MVDNEDVEGCARAFLTLIGDPERAAAMGRAGRELVEREFDWRQIMKKECALYSAGVLERPW